MDFLDHWAVGPDVSRGYGVVEWYHLGHPGAKAFIEKYQKVYPSSVVLVPENNCYDGYVGTKALLLAIEKAGATTDVPKVIEALENLKASTNRILPYDSEVISRTDIQENPPDILMTNYVMLDLLLTRFSDRSLFPEEGPSPLKFLVLCMISISKSARNHNFG
jgi:hypothetical protein